jgi:hypothetical protein
MSWKRLLSLAGLAVVGVLLAVSASIAPAANGQGRACIALQVQNIRPEALSALSRIELPGGAVTQLGEIGYRVNAMGYSPEQNLVYGVAEANRNDQFPGGAHVVTIDRDAQVTDLGPVSREGGQHVPWSVITGATAGAIHGNKWYLRKDSSLYTVDISPASRSYLTVLRVTPLRLTSLAVGVDDFDFDPADGLLYGVSMSWLGNGSVVTIDPGTGSVRTVPGLRLPAGGPAGSAVIGADGALYVTSNRDDQRSVLYRISRDGSGSVTELSSGPQLATSDAAGCLTETTSPPVSTPPVSTPPGNPPPGPLPLPNSPPTGSHAASPPPNAPAPTLVPTPAPTSAVVPAGQSSPPPLATISPPATRVSKPLPSQPLAAAVKRDHHTALKRRWGLAVLVLIFGASAAAHGMRRGR